jgi:hypothetical protein
MKTKPEWPTGEQDVVWKFAKEPVTVYSWSSTTVYDSIGKLLSVSFGRNAQHPKSIRVHKMEPRARSASYFYKFNWFEPAQDTEWGHIPTYHGDGWLVIAKGYHPLPQKPIIERHESVTVHSGNESISIETFNSWLIEQRLELLVDFRDIAIAEGWRPSYGGCAADPPRTPPPELAHWWPERVSGKPTK